MPYAAVISRNLRSVAIFFHYLTNGCQKFEANNFNVPLIFVVNQNEIKLCHIHVTYMTSNAKWFSSRFLPSIINSIWLDFQLRQLHVFYSIFRSKKKGTPRHYTVKSTPPLYHRFNQTSCVCVYQSINTCLEKQPRVGCYSISSEHRL